MCVSRFSYRLLLVSLMVLLLSLPACSSAQVKETETPLPAAEETSTPIFVEETETAPEQVSEEETAVPEAEDWYGGRNNPNRPGWALGRQDILVAGSTLPMEVVFNSEVSSFRLFWISACKV